MPKTSSFVRLEDAEEIPDEDEVVENLFRLLFAESVLSLPLIKR